MVRRRYNMKTDSGFIVAGGEKNGFVWLYERDPMQKSGNIGRNKENDKPKSKTTNKKGKIQVRKNHGPRHYDRQITKIDKESAKSIPACVGIR